MRAILGLLLAAATLLGSHARADSWLPPSTQSYASEDGQWRLTIVPRGIASPLRYFQDKVAGRPNPGAKPGSTQEPLGLMAHQVQGRWQRVWSAPLVNETAPVDAIVSAQGLAVTFDNWHSVGRGADVVVVYDGSGHKVRSLTLADILPRDYVRALPRSVSSTHWGSKHGFSPDGKQLILRVKVPQKDADEGSVPPEYVQIRLEAATGLVVPPEGPDWDRALAAAQEVNAERKARLAREYEELKAPLVAPDSNDEGDWHGYLREAYYRVAHVSAPNYPPTGFVPAGGPEFEERNQRLVRKAIEEAGAVIILGSPDPAQLIRALRKVIAELPPNGLRQTRVYVTVTPALREAAAQAIAPSGAAFVALDTTVALAQVPERLERLQEFQQGMESVR